MNFFVPGNDFFQGEETVISSLKFISNYKRNLETTTTSVPRLELVGAILSIKLSLQLDSILQVYFVFITLKNYHTEWLIDQSFTQNPKSVTLIMIWVILAKVTPFFLSIGKESSKNPKIWQKEEEVFPKGCYNYDLNEY